VITLTVIALLVAIAPPISFALWWNAHNSGSSAVMRVLVWGITIGTATILLGGVRRTFGIGRRQLPPKNDAVRFETRSGDMMDMLIQEMTHRDSTQPRDRIYAVYGVLKEFIPELELTSIQIDKPINHIHRDFFLDLLQSPANEIKLLMLAKRKETQEPQEDTSPSWVPDFGPDGFKTDKWLSTVWQCLHLFNFNATSYSASSNPSAATIADLRNRSNEPLVVWGCWLKDIAAFAHGSKILEENAEDRKRGASNLRSLVRKNRHHQSTTTGDISDVEPVGCDINKPHGRSLHKLGKKGHNPCVGCYAHVFSLTEVNPNEVKWFRTPKYGSGSDKKRYLGLCPDEARPGDEIALIEVVPVPMLLRKDTRRLAYRVIGPVIVDGMMFGEGWKVSEQFRTSIHVV
jgi:hypothetical protein